jgi:hypothetical protein
MANLKDLKSDKRRFVGIPREVLSSKVYIDLAYPAKSLLFDITYQYNGRNNGNLTACYTIMKERGWPKATLYRAFSGLVHSGFVVVTRQGMKVRGFPTLVAITFKPIDEPPANITYDFGVTKTRVRLDYWAVAKKSWKIQPTLKNLSEI